MVALTQQFAGLRLQPFSKPAAARPSSGGRWAHSRRAPASRRATIVAAYTIEKQLRGRLEFRDHARELANTPESLYVTEEDIMKAVAEHHFQTEIGTMIKGMVVMTDADGAFVDMVSSEGGFLPVYEASIHRLKHVCEAGLVPGVIEEFMIVGESDEDSTLILSLKSPQYDLAWERCRQLQAEDVVVKGKITGGNRGGIVALVEGLRGFIPYSQISSQLPAEDLIDRELPLKFMEVDEEESRLVLSNRKAIAESQAQLGIGSVVTGTVESLKPYGAFIDIGGINGLLHVSQISHDRVADIETVLQPGDTLKVMILSHDRERGRVSLSTKKLEPTPGDMIRNPELVFEKADEMALAFRQRIAQAEAMARQDMLRFQPESSGLALTADGILGSFSLDLPGEGLDLNEVPTAEE